MKRLIFIPALAFSMASSSGATNDLCITSIARVGDCTTLNWRSHPREYYTVYWTDDLRQPVFWRVAEVNVPSGGTNTTWTEGGCSESMMTSAPPPPTMSAEERAVMLEKAKGYETPAWLYPPGHPKNPDRSNPIKSPWRLELEQSGALEGDGNGPLALLSGGGGGVSHKFFRVARTGVAGFIDGWGYSLGTRSRISRPWVMPLPSPPVREIAARTVWQS